MLPNDIARCSGNGKEACIDCRRRELGDCYHQWHTNPIATELGCENRIPPEKEEKHG